MSNSKHPYAYGVSGCGIIRNFIIDILFSSILRKIDEVSEIGKFDDKFLISDFSLLEKFGLTLLELVLSINLKCLDSIILANPNAVSFMMST